MLASVADKTTYTEFYSPVPDGYRKGFHRYVAVVGTVMSGLGKGIFASSAAKMPKSAYAANSQAKVAAAAIVAKFNELPVGDPTFVNTCYSILSHEHGISVAAVYSLDRANNMIMPIKGAGGLSPMDASDAQRKREVSYAHSWFKNVINDMLE